MRWGISTLLINEMDLSLSLRMLDDLAINHLEIRAKQGHFNYDDEDCINSLKSILEETGKSVYSIHMPTKKIDISYLNEVDRVRSVNEIKKAALALLSLGGKMVVVHPGGRITGDHRREDLLAQSAKSLQELDCFLAGSGLKLVLENTLPPRIGSRIEELLTILKCLNSKNAGICLDTGHINIKGIPFVALKKIKKQIIHLHVADNLGEDDDHLLPGQGKIDWENFIKILKEIDYRGIFMLEVKRRGGLSEMIRTINETKNNFCLSS